eukprot:6200383-Pleurochrysis_carterae.AAC.1
MNTNLFTDVLARLRCALTVSATGRRPTRNHGNQRTNIFHTTLKTHIIICVLLSLNCYAVHRALQHFSKQRAAVTSMVWLILARQWLADCSNISAAGKPNAALANSPRR